MTCFIGCQILKILLIFWIQIFSIEKEQDAQKTNIPLGHYGYGYA